MKSLNNTPFDNLRVAYFRVYDKPGEQIFFDASDEQILSLLSRQHGETVVISRIEDVEVLDVVTRYPKKNKLDISELKIGKTNEEIAEHNKKMEQEKAMRQKYK